MFSDFLNLFIFNNKENIGAVVKALQAEGLPSRASPSRTSSPTTARKPASWPAASSPCRSSQGSRRNARQHRVQRVRHQAELRPTVAGDTIRLKVRPEVSTLDFANGITLEGFRIPALTTRRAETDVELRDGQSFAIAGLLNNLSQDDTAAIPFLGAAHHRPSVQEQGGTCRADGADGADHAAAGAAAESRRGAAAADAASNKFLPAEERIGQELCRVAGLWTRPAESQMQRFR